MSLPSNVYESIHRAWMGDTLEGLKDFIRIPAKSRAFNPNWESDGILKRTLEDSAEWGRRLLPCGVLTCHRCGPCPRHTDRDPGGRILIISHTHLVGIACQLAHLVGNVVGTTGNAKRQEQRGCSHPFR